jgi:hypothetical protein
VPGVAPERLLAQVDAEIGTLLAERPPPAGTTGNHFYFEPPRRLPASDAALRDSPALRLAEALVAPLTLDHGLDHIQVALNIPPYSHRPARRISTAIAPSRPGPTHSPCSPPYT